MSLETFYGLAISPPDGVPDDGRYVRVRTGASLDRARTLRGQRLELDPSTTVGDVADFVLRVRTEHPDGRMWFEAMQGAASYATVEVGPPLSPSMSSAPMSAVHAPGEELEVAGMPVDPLAARLLSMVESMWRVTMSQNADFARSIATRDSALAELRERLARAEERANREPDELRPKVDRSGLTNLVGEVARRVLVPESPAAATPQPAPPARRSAAELNDEELLAELEAHAAEAERRRGGTPAGPSEG